MSETKKLSPEVEANLVRNEDGFVTHAYGVDLRDIPPAGDLTLEGWEAEMLDPTTYQFWDGYLLFLGWYIERVRDTEEGDPDFMEFLNNLQDAALSRHTELWAKEKDVPGTQCYNDFYGHLEEYDLVETWVERAKALAEGEGVPER